MLLAMALVSTMFMFTLSTQVDASGSNYYVDSVAGDDSNNGTSENTAWKTLSKVNSVTFLPGDTIYLKSGSVWAGTLYPKGSGDISGQITIDKYGTGSTPIIDGAGASEAVKLYNQEYWTIQNLEIKNIDPTPGSIEERNGVRIIADGSGHVLDNIFLNNLNVHDVEGSHVRSGSTSFYNNGGIKIDFGTTTPLAKYNNLKIENCTISDVKTVGILFYPNANGYAQNIASWSTNVIVRNNSVSNTGADGILMSMCDGPLIEYNISANAGILGDMSTSYIAGIWSANTNNAVFQYNECYGTKRYDGDGAAWDTDWGDAGTHIYQYNYSHDNEGGSKIGPFNSAPYDSPNLVKDIFRYNISQNDGTNEVWIGMGSVVDIYNNVFYCGSSNFRLWSRDGVQGSLFRNNIVVAGSASYSSAAVYDSNLYSGHTAPNDPNKVTADPMFVNAGSGGNGIDSVEGYKLISSSPAINAGTVIADNGSNDYWGNALYKDNPDIGVHEFQGTPTAPTEYMVNNDDSAIVYSGSWGTSGNRGVGDYSDDVAYTLTNDDYVEYTFTGTGIDYVTEKNSDMGDVDIYIDDVFQETVSCNNSSRLVQQTVYSKTGLVYGPHKIKVVKKNGTYALMDAFKYYTSQVTPPTEIMVNNSDSTITYSSGWGTDANRGVGDYQDDVAYTTGNNGSFEYTFTGTGVEYITESNSDQGEVDIYIDGVFEETVNCYSATRLTQQTMFSTTGLTSGSHTIKGVKKNGQYMLLDAIRVHQ